MQHFKEIRNLPQLKRIYRTLAKEHHPDKGGDTAIMQEINAEFEKLYEKLRYVTVSSEKLTGYEEDYTDATASQYRDYVYNEYRYVGKNYKGQSRKEILEVVRQWLKETYPRYKFSVTGSGYKSINIFLLSSDFDPFTEDSGYSVYISLNPYHVSDDERLTDRAKEVMTNIRDFVMSYNFDDSDAMTDYFHTNFYLSLGIGRSTKPFKKVIPKLVSKNGDEPPEFKHPEGNAHKMIRRALNGARFSFYQSQRYGKIIVLGTDNYWEKGEHLFYAKHYSSAKQAQKRIDKLTQAGIRCRMLGYNGGMIEFLGYTPETEAALERERNEQIEAFEKWRLTL